MDCPKWSNLKLLCLRPDCLCHYLCKGMQLCLWVLHTYIRMYVCMYTYTCVHSTVCIVGLLPSHVFYSPVVPSISVLLPVLIVR